MAKQTVKDLGISFLRRNKPFYCAIRASWRSLQKIRTQLIRWSLPRACFCGLPQGLFSLVPRVQDGEVKGRLFFENQVVPVFPAHSLVKRCGLRQDEFQPWPVFCAELGRTRLFGQNLVPLNDRKEACLETMFAEHGARSDESYRIPTFQKATFLPGRWTSLVSRWDGGSGYWHFLMDVLPRLHTLPEFPPDTGILVRGPVARWQWEVLRMLGVADRVRPTPEKHLLVEDFYFSSHTSMTGAYNPFAVQFLRKQFLRPTEIQRGEKFFIARGANWTRGIRNQEDVSRFFQKRGWNVIEPEQFSIQEQIRMFARAEAVCGAHGSALTNLLWMSPGAQVMELLADNFILGSFEWLARCVGLQHEFLIFPGDHRLSFEVDLERLAKRKII